MEDYKEIELFETQLRVYRDGTIWRLCKGNSKGCKKGDWKLVKGVLTYCGYLLCRISEKMISIHRIIAYCYLGLDITNPQIQIDHINRIRTDNQVDNLRISDNIKNQCNKGAKGYSFDKKTGKYKARITVNKKSIHLGYYDTAEEASNAYQSAKLVHHAL
jgi:hypothetical protein